MTETLDELLTKLKAEIASNKMCKGGDSLCVGRLQEAVARLSSIRDGLETEKLAEIVGKTLGPHLAISPTPRHVAVVNNFIQALRSSALGEE